MTRTLVLVRHAEAVSHDDDPTLSPLGRRQADACGSRLAALLAGVDVDAVLHGPRRRAAATATTIGRHLRAPAVIDDALTDRTPVATDQSCFSERVRAFLAATPADERDPDGMALDRAIQALAASRTGDRTTVAVTHNFVIGWFVRHVLDAPAQAWIGLSSANTGITRIDWTSDRVARVVCFNDTGHLDHLL